MTLIGNTRLVLRFSLTVFMILYLAVSTAADERYYREHPELIHAALMRCPVVSPKPKKVSCETLEKIAKESTAILLELERNPQQYGLDIMHMQAVLAEQMAGKSAQHDVSQQDLARIQANLVLRLALIRSLESPQGLG